jgi:protein-disulfide isomerase
MENTHRKSFTLTTPIAVLLGFIIMTIVIAGSGYYLYSDFKKTVMGGGQANQQPEPSYTLEAVAPITNEDHIRGNPNAKVKIVEYSDTECPFCKRFHFTMTDLMKEYGNNGDVAWVYRHMPLPQLHQKAQKEAEATECAEELGGKDAFWKYLDRMMEITPSNDGLETKELTNIAKYVGLNATSFNECLNSGRMADKVNAQAKNGAETGGNGTPWSIVIGPNKKLPLSGAMPIDTIKAMIEEAKK